MWEDWEQQLKEHPEVEVDKRLLWEYNMKDFDWQKERHIVIERVINIGTELNPAVNVLALFKMYGGYSRVRTMIRNEVFGLSNYGEEYVCKAFDLEKSELESYRRKQKRIALFGEPVDKTDWW
jgi:hypothetical protein